MAEFLTLLPALQSMPVLQLIVGGIVAFGCFYVFITGKRTPASVAPATLPVLGDSAAYFQGPREMLDTWRQIRDLLKSICEHQRETVELLHQIRERQVLDSEITRDRDRDSRGGRR